MESIAQVRLDAHRRRRGGTRHQGLGLLPYRRSAESSTPARTEASCLRLRAHVSIGPSGWPRREPHLAFVLWSQQPDGSWLYAMDGKDAFVDNFHTCFVLKNLFKAWRVLGDEELHAAIDKGYGFYKSHLLDERGLPVPFARTQRLTLQRRELYDFAEGINLGLLLADVDRRRLGDRHGPARATCSKGGSWPTATS